MTIDDLISRLQMMKNMSKEQICDISINGTSIDYYNILYLFNDNSVRFLLNFDHQGDNDHSKTT